MSVLVMVLFGTSWRFWYVKGCTAFHAMSWLELNSFSFRWLKCQVHCYSLVFHELSHLYMSVLVMALFVTSWRFWFVKGCNQPFMVCHGWNWNHFHLDDFSIMLTLFWITCWFSVECFWVIYWAFYMILQIRKYYFCTQKWILL